MADQHGHHLVLVGMMASGKSEVGRLVAQRLGRVLFDSDEQIESMTHKTVREIWESDGEATFRRLESQVLADAVAREEPAVIAAAGGVVLEEENRRRLSAAGTVVWLDAEPAVLAQRVQHGDHRPLLDGDPGTALRRLDAERRPLYVQIADHVIDSGEWSLDEMASMIVKLL